MRGWIAAVSLLAGLLTAGCSAEERPGARSVPGLGPYQVTEQLELRIGGLPNLVSWHRDVVVTCSGPGRDQQFDGCEVGTIDASGKVTGTAIRGVRTARRVQRGIVVLKANRELILIAADGSERRLAEQVANPGVAPEGDRMAYIQGTVPETRIVFQHLGSGETRTVTTDPTAYAPHVIPGSDDVLFVSGRTGVASYFVATADGSERQVTNIGLREVTKGFVPVAVSQLVWLPGTQSCVFTAHYGSDALWHLDLATGRGRWLGSGSHPNLEQGGAVLAFDRGPAHYERPPRVSRYLGGI